VIGADGRHSVVADAIKPEQYNDRPSLESVYYTYWSGVPMAAILMVVARPEDSTWQAHPADCLNLSASSFSGHRIPTPGDGREALNRTTAMSSACPSLLQLF
jgi:2-polyprenyl-6-methoxyphenol hydroxylase-like FAD-dependent oxidoreductase